MDNEVIEGKPTHPAHIFYKNIILKMATESISDLEDIAKNLMVSVGILEGIYFHAISYIDLKIVFNNARYIDFHWVLVSIFSIPFLLWFIVLGCSIMVFFNKRYEVNPENPEHSERVYKEILNRKQQWLIRSLYILMVSFVILFINIVIFLSAI